MAGFCLELIQKHQIILPGTDFCWHGSLRLVGLHDISHAILMHILSVKPVL